MKRSMLALAATLGALALLMALAFGNLQGAKSALAQPSSGLQPQPTPTPAEPGQLKVCKIARPGVTPGTIFTINVNGTPYSVPAARSPGLCVLAGQFPLNTQVTVQEVIPAGYAVSAIQVSPDNRRVSKDVTLGKVIVKIGTGVTEVVYVDKVSALLSSSSRQAAAAQDVQGRLEICKEADGAGVSGNFTFRFAGKTRTIPVGACTPIIVVPVGPLTITEDARAGYAVSDIYTIPADRLISENLSARSATVTIVQGRASTQTVVVFRNRTVAANQTPVVELTTSPAPGEPFAFGQTVTYQVNVTDDSPIDCSRVSVAYILGHEQHGHPQTSTVGCSGSIVTFLDPGHAGANNLSAVFAAQYTDLGGLTGSDEVVLVPNP